MIRIYLFFFYHKNNPAVATYTSDEIAIKIARNLRAEALFCETDIFNLIPSDVPKSATTTRELFFDRWTEINIQE